MRFERLYRASLYLTLFLATLLLSIDASLDNRFAMLFPVAVAGASALAFVTVDRDPRRGLPRGLANVLGLVSFGLGVLEWNNDPSLLLLAIGHALVLLQIIKYFLPKTVEDDWYLFLLSLVQAVIGVYISQSDEVGVLLLAWAVASLWTFGLFFLRRESLREGPPAGVTILPATDRVDPYPGLLNAGFFLATLRVAATTLALGAGIFLLMPRWAVRGGSRSGQVPTAKHLTGFSETVTLGHMGEILENDSIVLSVEFSDEEDRVITPPPEILLRGVTLVDYGKNDLGQMQWTREATHDMEVWRFPPVPRGTAQVRQRIKMEATDSDVLFSLRPILWVRRVTAGELVMNRLDGTLARRDLRRDYNAGEAPRPSKYDYTVYSAAEGPALQLGEIFPNGPRKEALTHVPESIESGLREIVEPILAAIPPDRRDSPSEQVEALERYLRDGEFSYTLKMQATDPSLDPVLDFLRNRKSGHCEYFASALTLMCRVAGVPARMVNGFKGGDYNELGRVLHVREKHAHSWVEALVTDGDNRRFWKTLDATPGRQRDEIVANVGGGWFRSVRDYLRSVWTFDIVGFDGERQERRIYGPIRQLAEIAAQAVRSLVQSLRNALKWFYFENVGQFFSIRGFVVSVLAMLFLVGLIWFLAWLLNRLLGRSGKRETATETRDPSLAFYYRLVRIFEDHGLVRPPAETPREFARRASLALEGRDAVASRLVSIPATIVDAFYSKRFGLRELPPEMIRDLDARLTDLEAELSAPSPS